MNHNTVILLLTSYFNKLHRHSVMYYRGKGNLNCLTGCKRLFGSYTVPVLRLRTTNTFYTITLHVSKQNYAIEPLIK